MEKEFCDPHYQGLSDSYRHLLLITAPILAFPDFEKPFILYTKSSGFAMGMILGQVDSTGREVVVSFAGRTLNKHEVNYTVTEQEALAVVTGVKHYKHYLVGRRFTIITDHVALVWLLNQKQPRGRIARWILTLQSFDFVVKHKPGEAHKNADAISRITNLPEILALDNSDTDLFSQENIKKDSVNGYNCLYLLGSRIYILTESCIDVFI